MKEKKYALAYCEAEFDYVQLKDIRQGCTVEYNLDSECVIDEFTDKESALDALTRYKSTITVDYESPSLFHNVTEYFVEEYDIENGDCVGNFVFYFAEFDEASKKIMSKL